MIILILLILLNQLQLNVQCISLGGNLIQNSKFQHPNVLSQGVYFQQIPFNIPGWSCTHICQVDDCQKLSQLFMNYGAMYGNCQGQVLDISSNQIQIITQIIETTQGNYILSVEYLIPCTLANKKILLIYFNQKLVYSYHPLVDYDSQPHFVTLNLQTRRGRNNLTFTQSGHNDAFGFRLSMVQLRRQIYRQIQAFISGLFDNYVILGIVSFPGSRVLLNELVSSLVSFDRMQLYYYHNRNYSYYAHMLLSNISSLMSKKGQFSLNIQKKILGTTAQQEQSFLSQYDYKYNYINTEVISKSQNGYGFLSNNLNLIVYSLPFYLVSIAALYLFFRLTFDYRISKVVRKYSYFGIIIVLMVNEGNVQQYSFYAFGELKIFFSLNYGHKLVNCVIAGFFYIVLMSSVALNFIIWSRYNKNCKYFVDNVQLCLGGITTYTINSCFFYMLLGALHQLLLTTPNFQLLALGITQLLWIIAQIYFLRLNFYKTYWVVWRNIIEGLFQITFQLTLYIYDSSTQQGGFINSQIHLRQIIMLIAVWMLQLGGDILFFVNGCAKMFYQYRKKAEIIVKKPKRIFKWKNIIVERYSLAFI